MAVLPDSFLPTRHVTWSRLTSPESSTERKLVIRTADSFMGDLGAARPSTCSSTKATLSDGEEPSTDRTARLATKLNIEEVLVELTAVASCSPKALWTR